MKRILVLASLSLLLVLSSTFIVSNSTKAGPFELYLYNEECVGCGVCVEELYNWFGQPIIYLDDNGKAHFKEHTHCGSTKEKCSEALPPWVIDNALGICPASCFRRDCDEA